MESMDKGFEGDVELEEGVIWAPIEDVVVGTVVVQRMVAL